MNELIEKKMDVLGVVNQVECKRYALTAKTWERAEKLIVDFWATEKVSRDHVKSQNITGSGAEFIPATEKSLKQVNESDVDAFSDSINK